MAREEWVKVTCPFNPGRRKTAIGRPANRLILEEKIAKRGCLFIDPDMVTGSGPADRRAYLQWEGGRLLLVKSCIIGRRSDNDLSFNDAQVSRRHALLMRVNDEWWVNDLDSRNGVSVNGLKIKSARRLRHGDQILISGHPIIFHHGGHPHRRTSVVGQSTQMTLAEQDATAPRQDLIIASAIGEILEGEKAAHRFFGTLSRPAGATYYLLPTIIRQWIERIKSPDATSTPLELHEGDKSIVVSLKNATEEGRFFLTLREDSVKSSIERLQSLGLTPRQAEVMHWVGQGRTNAEVATILNMTVHTVNRHVEHIFCKLGVENRQQAITVVRDRLGM